jgi:hypothetical protein
MYCRSHITGLLEENDKFHVAEESLNFDMTGFGGIGKRK